MEELQKQINNLQKQLDDMNSMRFVDVIRNSVVNDRVIIDSANPPTTIEDTQGVPEGGGSVTFIRFPDGFIHIQWKNKIYKVPFYDEIEI